MLGAAALTAMPKAAKTAPVNKNDNLQLINETAIKIEFMTKKNMRKSFQNDTA